MAKWMRKMSELWGNLAVRSGIYAAVALLSPVVIKAIGPWVPAQFADLAAAGALGDVLTLIASNMLTIVTFSLSTMVASLSLILSSAPPRATALIARDTRAQRALSTFVGAFVFSIASFFALSSGTFDGKDRFVLLCLMTTVLTCVIWTIVRWIGHLAGMGQLHNVIGHGTRAARLSIMENDFLFVLDAAETRLSPLLTHEVRLADHCGFIQRIEYGRLAELGDQHDVMICVHVAPGNFVQPGTVLLSISGLLDETSLDSAREVFQIGDRRVMGRRSALWPASSFGDRVPRAVAGRE